MLPQALRSAALKVTHKTETERGTETVEDIAMEFIGRDFTVVCRYMAQQGSRLGETSDGQVSVPAWQAPERG